MHPSWSARLRFLSIIAATGGVLSLLAAPAGAQVNRAPSQGSRTPAATYVPGAMGIPQPEPTVTLSMKQKSLARVLYELFKQSRYSYRLLADVGTAVFSIDVNKMPLSEALRTLLAQDKRPDPLVFFFNRSPTGGGEFVIDREYIEIGEEDGERRVSLANARITRVLPMVFERMKVQARIEPDVPPITVSLQLRPDSWAQVLPALMSEASEQEPALTYSLDGDTYVVHIQKTFPGPAAAAAFSGIPIRRVTLAASGTPLRDVLAQLFQGSGWKYQVADAVKDTRVTYNGTGEAEISALQGVLRHVGTQGQQVTYREGKGVLYIEPGPMPGQFEIASRAIPTVLRTTLNLPQRPLKDIAKVIGDTYKTQVTVAPNVPNLRIDYKVSEATLAQAVDALVRAGKVSLPNLTVRQVPTGHVLQLGQ